MPPPTLNYEEPFLLAYYPARRTGPGRTVVLPGPHVARETIASPSHYATMDTLYHRPNSAPTIGEFGLHKVRTSRLPEGAA